jgi:hypothetical protein
MQHKIKDVHITTIKPGDAIIHNDILKTVCAKDIKKCPLMGITLFGDSYHIGHKKVQKAHIQ